MNRCTFLEQWADAEREMTLRGMFYVWGRVWRTTCDWPHTAGFLSGMWLSIGQVLLTWSFKGPASVEATKRLLKGWCETSPACNTGAHCVVLGPRPSHPANFTGIVTIFRYFIVLLYFISLSLFTSLTRISGKLLNRNSLWAPEFFFILVTNFAIDLC